MRKTLFLFIWQLSNGNKKKLFPFLPAWKPKNKKISSRKILEQIKRNSESHERLFMGKEPQTSKSIPAGYTYLGQFIAHDLTFSKETVSDLLKGPNSRTPGLDLDSLYGKGPLLEPIYYHPTEKGTPTHFRTKTICENVVLGQDSNRKFILKDLFRIQSPDTLGSDIPVIPDIRNDENILLSQLHLAFQLLHNKIANQLICNNKDLKNDQKRYEVVAPFLKNSQINAKKNDKSPTRRHGITHESYRSEKADDKSKEIIKSLEKIQLEKTKSRKKFEQIFKDYNEEMPFPRVYGNALERSISNEDSMAFHSQLGIFFPLNEKNFDEFLHFVFLSNQYQAFKENNSVEENVRSLDIEPPFIISLLMEANALEKTPIIQETIVKIQNKNSTDRDRTFIKAREQVLQIYHRIILYDYLPRIIQTKVLHDILPFSTGKKVKRFFFLKKFTSFLPIEFTVAFFRFGHSMVREVYHFHKAKKSTNSWSLHASTVFGERTNNGKTNLFVDWRNFFFPEGSEKKIMSNRIAPFISHTMIKNLGLSDGSSRSIVFRNLERSRRKGLPAGQDVALLMWLFGKLSLNDIIWYKRIKNLGEIQKLAENFPKINNYTFEDFCDHSPLWFYTLLEAYSINDGNQLGPVASRIVGEVLIGLLEDAPNSILKEKEINFDLAKKECAPKKPSEIYSMIQLLKYINVYDGVSQDKEPKQDCT